MDIAEGKFPSPLGSFFMSIFLKSIGWNKEQMFPSPMGIFFIFIANQFT